MFVLLMACSVSERGMYTGDELSYEQDTGDWNTAPEDDNAEGVDADFTEEEPYWWKLFAELQWDIATEEFNADLSRVLYDEDMVEICQQELSTSMITAINSPIGDGAWLSMEIGALGETGCNYTRNEGELILGIGELYPDLEIALEMVLWKDSIEENLYSEYTPYGGYAIFGEAENVLAFGAAYPSDVSSDIEVEIDSGGWVIRPIYSFKW